MVLDIKNIVKRYKDVVALNDFSLHMENGLYGFLGENGAGKSTLIKILSCNLVQDEGVILADGKDIRLTPEEYRKRIGYMPQESVGYPGMRVQEFMEYMAVLKGLSLKEPSVKEQILRLLRQVHLEEHMKKKFSQLSGGMKRRLLFAQAVLGNPSLLILDEPTAGLDPNERIAMRNLIAKEALDRIVILATHIISDVECCGRVMLFFFFFFFFFLFVCSFFLFFFFFFFVFVLDTATALYIAYRCVCIASVDTRSRASFAIRFLMAIRSFGSSPAVGSSRISNDGFPRTACANNSLRFIPPESCENFFFICSSKCTCLSKRNICSFTEGSFNDNPFRTAIYSINSCTLIPGYPTDSCGI